MAEGTNQKNPLLAALMSAFVIGTGHFYLRNPLKALSYMALMAALIVAQVHADRAEHHVFIALLMSAFYFFQIFDAYQDAKELPPAGQTVEKDEETPSMWAALALIAVGILLQLSNLEVLDLRLSDLIDLWPLAMILLGLKMVFGRKHEEK